MTETKTKTIRMIDLGAARSHSCEIVSRLYDALKQIDETNCLLPYGASLKLNDALGRAYELKDLLAKTFPDDAVTLEGPSII